MIDAELARRATCALLGFALALQSAELLALGSAPARVWTRALLREELRAFPRPLAELCDAAFAPAAFRALLWLRFAAALALLTLPSVWLVAKLCVVYALVSSLLVCVRFRGVFNGGSDSMTIAVLCGLTCATADGWALRLGLVYIAVQALASYTIAGLVKLKEAEWRSGRALVGLLRLRAYGVPAALVARVSAAPRLFSWSVITFECAAPWSLTNTRMCAVYLALAFLFHLGTVLAFGLNRFVWAWAASYPALLWLAEALSAG